MINLHSIRARFFLMGSLVVMLTASLPAESLNSVAKALTKGTQKLKTARIAVLLFPYDNGDLSSGSTIVSEELVTLLAQHSKIKVVERSLLANVLSEIKLEESGVTASSGAAPTGGILNVDAVVTGSLSDGPHGETRVNARLIQLPTGEILAAAAATIDRTWDDSPKPVVTLAEKPEDDKNDPAFQNSDYIYTPWARQGNSAPLDTPQVAVVPQEARPEPTQTVVFEQPVPVAPAEYVTIIPAHAHPYDHHPHPWKNDPARTQLLYSLGVTLDAQGHNHQAEGFYRQVVQQTPVSSPFRIQAESRLSAHSK